MRDTQLDCYRALTMIYIVCVIHIIYWFGLGNELIKSIALFEMPIIFFIAGASQSYNKNTGFKNIVISRIKRILLPYYVFVPVLFMFFFICTINSTAYYEQDINIFSLNAGEIAKILITGGSDKIPYLGYTWFISVYMIISCSFPLQKKILNKIPYLLYISITLGAFVLWKITGINSPENIIENFLLYNFFYIIGYTCYKNIKCAYILFLCVPLLIISAYLLISGIAIPMQIHKFPPDIIFMAYCLAIICILGMLFSKINIKYNRLLKIWNERGYTIYLYQSVSHFILYKVTTKWIGAINNDILVFIIYFILIMTIATALSCATYPIEKYVIGKIRDSYTHFHTS